MIAISKKWAVLNLLGWLLLYLFFIWVFWGEGGGLYNPLGMAAGALLGTLPVFYSHYALCWYWGNRRHWVLYVGGLLLHLALSPFLFMLTFGIAAESWTDFPVPYLPFVVLSFLFVVAGWIVVALQRWFVQRLRKESLEKQLVQAELQYLKAQINPHFLFNTLNNLHALAYKGSPDTPDAILRLSTLMRYMLYEANAGTVPLARELAYLQDLISLQQLRFNQASVVALEVSGEVESCQVAPLLFLPLLENAYKHSPAMLETGAISIRLHLAESSLRFSIENPLGEQKPDLEPAAGGFGLSNLRQRLQLLYPGQHSLRVEREKGLFRVTLLLEGLSHHTHEGQADLLYHR